MADLLEWLTGCLDHLEAVAVAGSRDDFTTWYRRANDEDRAAVSEEDGQVVVWDEGDPSDEQATHIALHDPRGILARVEGEAAIVRWHTPEPCCGGDQESCPVCWSNTREHGPCATLRSFAYGHRFDFPGYDTEAWAPEGADRG